ncbi:MAG: hypothetical protein C5B52_01645 [Bacteroidetes bacterium]|nr:MAG: hypothetical protein C5B52_01645 [Bacteroidota bacterium]
MKLLLVLLFPIFSVAQSDTLKLLDGKVSLVVPNTLKPMSDELWKLKYPTAPRPEFALSDASGEVNLIMRNTGQPIDESQLEEFKDFQLNAIRENRPNLEVQAQGIKTINGKRVSYFKMITQARDLKIFNYYNFVAIDGRVVMFTFNCTTRLQKKWEVEAEKIIQSLHIK